MKLSFKVHLPQQVSADRESEEENVMMDSVEDTEFSWSSGDHLSCFVPSVQLVSNDGMKVVRTVSCVIVKSSPSSSLYRDKCEATFDTNKSL